MRQINLLIALMLLPSTAVFAGVPAQVAAHVEPLPAVDTESDKVGALAGDFAVDASGAATYSVPIFTPPAPGGVAPSLSLSYSSRGGSGALGPGWGISGLSSVERCRKTKEHGDGDGPHGPIQWNNNDAYCLDGQRLIALTTTSCPTPPAGVTALAEYRTQIESFARICAYSNGSNSGPSQWTVQRRDGSVADYGVTADSRVERNNGAATPGAAVYRWALNRVRQPTGAFITYGYTEDASSGEHHLSSVAFAGRVDPGAPYGAVTHAPRNTVAFTYEIMPVAGQRIDYVAGSKLTLSKRLKSITVSGPSSGVSGAPAVVVRYYVLSYEANSEGSGLPRLQSVTECADSAQAVCKPATNFSWNGTTRGYQRTVDGGDASISALSQPLVMTGQKPADLNGDGRTDWVWLRDRKCSQDIYETIAAGDLEPTERFEFGWRLATAENGTVDVGYGAPSQNNGFGPYSYIETTYSCTLHPAQWNELGFVNRFHVYDFNGDGRDDVLSRMADGTWGVYLWNASGSLAQPYSLNVDAPNDQTGFADYTGDGLPDVIYASATQVYYQEMQRATVGGGTVTLSAPKIALLPQTTTWKEIWSLIERGKVFDANGDGLADLMVRVLGTGGVWRVFSSLGLRTGTTGSELHFSLLTDVTLTTAYPQNVRAQDFNGDGIMDLASMTYNDAGTARWSIQLGRGDGSFVALTSFGQAIATDARMGAQNLSNVSLSDWIDINQDGKLDLVYVPPAESVPPAGVCSATTGCTLYKRMARLGVFVGDVAVGDTGVQIGLFHTPTSLRSAHATEIFADLDADGDSELLEFANFGTGNGADPVSISTIWKVVRSKALFDYKTDTIHTITNGLGAQIKIEYAPLTHSSVYKRYKDAAALATGNGSPVFDTFSTMAVVKKVSRSLPYTDASNGVAYPNNLHETRYQYGGARVQAGGRGFLGFERRTEIDLARLTATTTKYHQDYPFIGQAREQETRLLLNTSQVVNDPCSDPNSAACLSYTTGEAEDPLLEGTTLSLTTWSHEAKSNSALKLVFPYTSRVETQSYTQFGLLKSITTETTTYTSDTSTTLSAACPVGTCGNVDSTTKTWAVDPINSELEETTRHFYDATEVNGEGNFTTASRWQLGLIGKTTVGRVNGQGFGTRTEAFGYDSKGLLEETITEPNQGRSLFLRTVLDREPLWGNITQTMRCSLHQEYNSIASCRSKSGFKQVGYIEDQEKIQRYSTTSYSSDGRFVAGTAIPYYDPSNPAGRVQSDRIVADADFNALGMPRKITGVNGVVTDQVVGVFGQVQFTRNNIGQFGRTEVRMCGVVSCPVGAKYRIFNHATRSSNPSEKISPDAYTYYDLLGREVARIDARYQSTGTGNRWSGIITQYDALGRVSRVSVPRFVKGPDDPDPAAATSACSGASSVGCWEKRHYDDLDRTTKVQQSVSSAAVAEAKFSYDVNSGASPTARARAVVAIDPNNNATLTDYNSVGEPIQIIDAMSEVSTLTYAPFGELQSVSKALDMSGASRTVTLSAEFDVRGRKVLVSDPDKGSQILRYNALGELIAVAYPDSYEIRRFYDSLGRVVSEATYHGETEVSDRRINRQYDSLELAPVATTTPLMFDTNYQVSSPAWIFGGTVSWTTLPSYFANAPALKLSATSQTTFATLDLPVTRDLSYSVDFDFQLAPGSGGDASMAVYAYYFDATGKQLARETIPLAQAGTDLPPSGHITREWVPPPDATLMRVRLSARYGTLHIANMRVIESDAVILPLRTALDKSASSATTIDFVAGALRTEADARIFYRNEYFYDAFGRPTWRARHNPAMATWAFDITRYDAYSRPHRQYETDFAPHRSDPTEELVEATELTYSNDGFAIGEKWLDPSTTRTLRVLLATDARGQATSERYSDNSDFKVSRVYDILTGRPIAIAASIGTDIVQSLSYTYDKNGNVDVRSDVMADRNEKYIYDPLNRLTRVELGLSATQTSRTAVLRLNYDALGNVTSKQIGNGTVSAYDYCPLADGNPDFSCTQLHAVKTVTQGTNTWMQDYDIRGNQTRMVESSNGITRVRDIEYDLSGRPTLIWATSRNDSGIAVDTTNSAMFEYGPDGQVIARQTPFDIDNVSANPLPINYDPTPKSAVAGHSNGPPAHARAWGHLRASFPRYTQALDEMEISGIRRPLAYSALRYPPGANPPARERGNAPKTLAAKVTCSQHTVPGSVLAPLLDRRAAIYDHVEFVSRSECGIARRIHIGGYFILEQQQPRSIYLSNFDWTTEVESPTQQVNSKFYTYQLKDALGSTDVQVKMTGNVTFTESNAAATRNPRYLSFDAHGQQRTAANTDLNGDGDDADADETPWQPIVTSVLRKIRIEGTWDGYTGHENFNGVGIIHMKGRIYDPMLGRFLQPDPIVEDDLNPQTWNRYTYVRNNPMTFTDPTGLSAWADKVSHDNCLSDPNCAVIGGATWDQELPVVASLRNTAPVCSVAAASASALMNGSRVEVSGVDDSFASQRAGADFRNRMEHALVRVPAHGINTAVAASATGLTLGLVKVIDYKDAALVVAEGVLSGDPVRTAFGLLMAKASHGSKAANAVDVPSTPPLVTKELAAESSSKAGGQALRVDEEVANGANEIGGSLSAARRLEFEPAGYHGTVDNAIKSRGPTNGQDALDSSLQVKDASPRRVGIDYATGDFVVFDETVRGVFHGHVRTWEQLHVDMQNTLRRAGMVDRRGNIPATGTGGN